MEEPNAQGVWSSKRFARCGRARNYQQPYGKKSRKQQYICSIALQNINMIGKPHTTSSTPSSPKGMAWPLSIKGQINHTFVHWMQSLRNDNRCTKEDKSFTKIQTECVDWLSCR